MDCLHCVGAVGIRQDHHGVRAQTIREVVDLLGHVLGGGKVDKVLGARLQDEVLLAPRVDADDAQADASGGDLCCQVSET